MVRCMIPDALMALWTAIAIGKIINAELPVWLCFIFLKIFGIIYLRKLEVKLYYERKD